MAQVIEFDVSVSETKVGAANAVRWGFTKLASIDNPKASKATKFGFLNAILYMAPASSAGAGNLCPNAGACAALCLGEHSGQAQIRKEGEDSAVTLARKARARAYMTERPLFMSYIARDVARLRGIASRLGLRLCYRFNGSTDVGVPLDLLRRFPDVTFIDYTKNPQKALAYACGRFPSNYHVTFSYDCGTETVASNETIARALLLRGVNVAVVFADHASVPALWNGHDVIDGDAHDIRIPEMDGRGVVIGLVAKGNKAKRDDSGFVVRRAA